MSYLVYHFYANKKTTGIISKPAVQSLSIKFSLQHPANIIFNLFSHQSIYNGQS